MKIKKKKITVGHLWASSLEELRGMIQALLNGIAKKKKFIGISNILTEDSIYEVLFFYKEKK